MCVIVRFRTLLHSLAIVQGIELLKLTPAGQKEVSFIVTSGVCKSAYLGRENVILNSGMSLYVLYVYTFCYAYSILYMYYTILHIHLTLAVYLTQLKTVLALPLPPSVPPPSPHPLRPPPETPPPRGTSASPSCAPRTRGHSTGNKAGGTRTLTGSGRCVNWNCTRGNSHCCWLPGETTCRCAPSRWTRRG